MDLNRELQNALSVINDLHPMVRHKLTCILLRKYGYCHDLDLLICYKCHITDNSIRGNHEGDVGFVYCNSRLCNIMYCYSCACGLYGIADDDDIDEIYDNFMCYYHRDPKLFDLLYHKLYQL